MKKSKIFLVYDAVLSLDGARLTVGGIQTYLMSLATVLQSAGWQVFIVQESIDDFDKEVDDIIILGRSVSVLYKKNKYKALIKRVAARIDVSRDLIIWGTFYYASPIKNLNTIAIQHGIGFDLVPESGRNNAAMRMGLGWLIKYSQRSSALRAFSNSKLNVCVDYNYLNWHRTFSLRKDDASIFVIPNFTNLPTYEINDKIEFSKLLFARRFVDWRGVTIMIKAAKKLLHKYDGLSVTFAGEGPMEHEILLLKEEFPNRIKITKYNQKDSLDFHRDFDISVVPTIGSEGTSLSLLEAMASGCAVICTNVGGMTNIIIDQYNGLMINPNEVELANAIERIHLDPQFGNKLASVARATVRNGFSKKIWSERWCSLISKVTGE